VTTPTGKIIKEEWRFKKDTYDKLFAENRLVFPKGGEGKPRYKLFLEEKKAQGVLANTWWDNLASNQEATREIKSLFDNLVFDTPKPIGLIKFCQQLASDKHSIILDFFAGSIGAI
jgi:adenine-specific DNA-methyltransferase